jgi:hypothetical protein
VIVLAVAGPALAAVRVQVPTPVVRVAGQVRAAEMLASAAAGVTVTVTV